VSQKKGGALVSVIIPVYNVEKYLNKCIKSILEQTYSNLEIIIINDGSTDNSLDIIKSNMVEDERIFLIDIENAGVSNARNLGLKKARGKYVVFVDSDDWVEKDYIDLLVHFTEKNSCQLAVSNFDNNEDDQNREINYDIKTITGKKELYHHLLSVYNFSGFLWNKIFIMDIIKKNKISFNNKLHINEDLVFLCDYFQYCDRAIFINKRLYNYIIRKNSALRSKFSYKQISKIHAMEKVINYYAKYDNDKLNILYYEYVIAAYKTLYILKINNVQNDKMILKCKKIIFENYKFTLKNVSFKYKIKLIIIRIFPNIYFKLNRVLLWMLK